MNNINETLLPKHIAFIMDGNGRWAQKRLMPRTYGHKAGAKSLRQLFSDLRELGVECATFYAFSTENWKRPEEEVAELMRLFDQYLDELADYIEENVRLLFIGDKSQLHPNLREKMLKWEETSKDNKGFTAVFAINYGSYDEITRAVKNLVSLAGNGFVKESDITPEFISESLDTKGLPPIDLMIRTGGEQRLSNFLLWQLAYAELYFCDTLWPDFGKKELLKAIEEFQGRNRRIGDVK